MRLHRVCLFSVFAACLMMVVPADAAPSRARTYIAPFAYAEPYKWNECVTGATCTLAGSAHRNGLATASIGFDRAQSTSEEEWLGAGASFAHYAFLPLGTRSARVTVTWRVSAASSAVRAQEGSLYANTSIASHVRCGTTCAKASTFRTITHACHSAITPCSLPLFGGRGATASSGPMDVQLVSEVKGVEQDMLTIQTTASGYVLATEDCTYVGEDCIAVIPSHRGSARAMIKAQLRSIRVQAT